MSVTRLMSVTHLMCVTHLMSVTHIMSESKEVMNMICTHIAVYITSKIQMYLTVG